MSDRRFRFGVVASPDRGPDQWQTTARRAADLGYSSVLMPDGLQLLSPFPSLAAAAATTDIRVGTFVAAAPLRTPRAAAWEAHTLTTLTDGRFEFGIGTGRPGTEQYAAELGLPFGSGKERRDQIRQTLDHLDKLDGDRHTPVMLAAGGPRSLALAAARADIVTLAAGPMSPPVEVFRMARELRALAGPRAAEIELAMNLFAAGDGDLPPWTRQATGVDPDQLRKTDSLMLLPGSPQEMADELLRRRDTLGTSYISINATYLDVLAPVVELLAGR
ncbi:alkanesulfonate monooxygenase SsuD/methylene tetrahydromethanopterin reductase-like flavin-dependent oxidoreductase (luciferase family) [Kribbella sp. VKM Ac-2527]|uniref:Alkanesulfonate monooxygenase SsuD/methylene tetrahydromethanopterin reductase-like flavin-dependent oxidoreductase (Luciferase family) n=1 Tax=Kribbella caucasensis TaxID=2512215 RepID=A0A4R6JIJ3_9ACTN|nr:LLM class flavin-dependent oxidoreductase [Kribbella sp. VKM Ac-2527]TDO34365.1 alkanesulfonate monooxygenase SsuD/methylene tetrahydromethanopterin reductase-like flavin-dependent oxidoreductase (luciferase family) [Kribbella sp. VKM Ac-2527]